MHILFPLFWLQGFIVVENVKTFTSFGDYNKHAHFLVCLLIFPLARHNSMLNIFSRKKKFTSQHKYSVLVDTSLKHSHLVLASVLFSKFCCDIYAFHKKSFFLLLLSSVSGVAHFTHASIVCHCLFFVLNALLSLQTKNNHNRASDLQQHFN